MNLTNQNTSTITYQNSSHLSNSSGVSLYLVVGLKACLNCTTAIRIWLLSTNEIFSLKAGQICEDARGVLNSIWLSGIYIIRLLLQ